MIRLVLVVACLAVLVLALWGIRRGWSNRGARQSYLPAPAVAPLDRGAELLPPLAGLYVGTTFARSWQDRVVHAGLGIRAAAVAHWYEAGLVIDREGADPIFVPAAAVLGARLAPALAGKVVGQGGLLVVGWRLGEDVLDSGLLAEDKTRYPEWVRSITGAVHQ